MPTMAGGNNSELSELRRRRGGQHQPTKESMVADQDSKQLQTPDLKVFNHAKSVINAVAALHLLAFNCFDNLTLKMSKLYRIFERRLTTLVYSNMINCDEHGEQVEGDLAAHPMSLLLVGCNKVLGLLVMLYLAYRFSFMSSYHFYCLDIMMIPSSY